MKTISYYKNPRLLATETSLPEVITAIKSGRQSEVINRLRAAKSEDPALYERLKFNLPAFTPSGLFNGSHKLENLVEYNSVIVLDIDKVGDKEAVVVRDAASKIEYTIAAFISPSGDGVKILVATTSTVDSHEATYNQLVQYYESALGVEVDKSGKNINRLCFMSYDPEMYYNEKAVAFNSNVSSTELPVFDSDPYTEQPNQLFANIITFTEKQENYHPGNRNNFIYLLANNLNRAGISQTSAEALILSKYNDAEMKAEIPAAIESAYKNTSEHGIFGPNLFATAATAATARSASSELGKGTPTIPEEVYTKLPKLLFDSSEAFELRREKDVFLTGALTILSGCFPSVEGIYDGRTVYLNLNCFIIAPPASGKGTLIQCRSMGQKIHEWIRNQHEANDSLGDVITAQNSPVVLYIPADSSSAAVKRALSQNAGVGIICETEAETLTSTFKQDWGGYTTIVLKSFQHEPITFSRAGEDDGIKLGEINNPKLSICLTGTPVHVAGLIKGTQDGLFSRFIYYTYRYSEKPVFKNVFKRTGVTNLTEYFDAKGDQVKALYDRVKEKGKIQILITDEQAEQFIERFSSMLGEVHDLHGEEALSTVLRLGLITYRIAMLLTMLHSLENDQLEDELTCSDDDFDIALQLSEVYLQHALSVFNALPGTESVSKNARSLFEFLPKQFIASEAVKIATVILGFSERVVYDYLNELTEVGWLKQPKDKGPYFNTRLQ